MQDIAGMGTPQGGFSPDLEVADRAGPGGKQLAAQTVAAVRKSQGVKQLLEKFSQTVRCDSQVRNSQGSKRGINVVLQIFFDMDHLGNVLVHETHIVAHVRFIEELVAGVNTQVYSSMMHNDIDTAIKKLDDAIHYLGTLENCKIIVVAPAEAEYALEVSESSGNTEAAGKLAVMQHASSEVEDVANTRIILTDSIFATDTDLLTAPQAGAGQIPPESQAPSSTATTQNIDDPFIAGTSDFPTLASSRPNAGRSFSAMASLEYSAALETSQKVRVSSPLMLTCTTATNTSIENVLPPDTSIPHSPISAKSARSRMSTNSSAATADSWTSWNTVSDATASSEATASVDGCDEEDNTHRSTSPSPLRPNAPLPIVETSLQNKQEQPDANPERRSAQPGDYFVPSKQSYFQEPRTRRLNPFFPMHKQLPRPPCNRHYLLERGCQDWNCSYLHDYLLTEAEVATMRINSKRTPCAYISKGHTCPDGPAKCHMGHSCPYGPECRYAERCVFLRFSGMHDAPAIMHPPKHLVDNLPYSANKALHSVAGSPPPCRSAPTAPCPAVPAASPAPTVKSVQQAPTHVQARAHVGVRGVPSTRGAGRGGYRGRGATRGRGGRV